MNGELLVHVLLWHKPRRNEIKQPYLEESIISRLAMTYLLTTVVQMKEAKDLLKTVERN